MIFQLMSGFLFLAIIVVLNLATAKYGYEIFSEYNPEEKLKSIHEDPRKFRTGILMLIGEHMIIILLAVSMFLAFGVFNLFLGVIWLICRGLEGLIQINNKRKFLGLEDIAGQYASASEEESDNLRNMALTMLHDKNSTFTIAQVLFSIGTLAYSIVFVFYDLIPLLIGWLGIVASIIYGLGNGVYLLKPNFKALWNVGGLIIFIYELILGGWLLFTPLLIP